MIVDNSHVFLQFSELGVHVQSEASEEIEIITWDKIKKKESALWSKLKIERHQVNELTIEILHSDLLGEISNPDWLGQLRNRENTSRVTDTQMNRLNLRRDTYSRSEPEDLFFNPR
jgi:hypothetical protein